MAGPFPPGEVQAVGVVVVDDAPLPEFHGEGSRFRHSDRVHPVAVAGVHGHGLHGLRGRDGAHAGPRGRPDQVGEDA
jgi:hypothetical protein